MKTRCTANTCGRAAICRKSWSAIPIPTKTAVFSPPAGNSIKPSWR